jgi:Zn-dependent M16 (insulinase) family peptidase
LIGEEFEKIKETVFDELDNIIQASSAIENINSILRPYLDSSKNQTSQKFLNIFMFYHNHRRYKAGKRKGKNLQARSKRKIGLNFYLILWRRKNLISFCK